MKKRVEAAKTAGFQGEHAARTRSIASMNGNEAIAQAEQAVTRARAIGDDVMLCQALMHLGMVSASTQRMVQAIGAFEDAADIGERLHDDDIVAQATANAGAMLLQVGQLDEALHATEDALQIFSQVTPSAESTASELRARVNLAVIRQSQGEWQMAIDLADVAMAQAKKSNDKEMILTLNILLADLYEELDDGGEKSRFYHQKAIQGARTSGQEGMVAQRLEKYGARLINDGMAQEALPVFFEVLKLYDKFQQPGGLYRASLQLGVIYQYQEKWPEALSALKDAEEYCVASGDTATRPFIDATMAHVLIGMENFEGALDVAQRAVEGYRLTDDKVGLGRALGTLGRAQKLRGEGVASRRSWDEGLAILDENEDAEGADNIRALADAFAA